MSEDDKQVNYQAIEHPQWIKDLNKKYQEACKASNFDLSAVDAKKFALMYTSAYMYYTEKIGKYSYYSKYYRHERDRALAMGKVQAYKVFLETGTKDSDKARESWVLENYGPYIDSAIEYMKAEANYETVNEYMRGISMIHYFCKELVGSSDSKFAVGSFTTPLSDLNFDTDKLTK